MEKRVMSMIHKTHDDGIPSWQQCISTQGQAHHAMQSVGTLIPRVLSLREGEDHGGKEGWGRAARHSLAAGATRGAGGHASPVAVRRGCAHLRPMIANVQRVRWARWWTRRPSRRGRPGRPGERRATTTRRLRATVAYLPRSHKVTQVHLA